MAFDLAKMLSQVSGPDTGAEQIEYIPLDLIDQDPNNFYQLTDIAQLARLKVIRDNLAKCWMPLWKKNNLSESQAYELAQLSGEQQQLIWDSRKTDSDRKYIHASTISRYADRFSEIEKLKCKKNKGQPCDNCQRKMKKAVDIGEWTYFHCDKCCSSCSILASCKHACPKLADKVKQLRVENKEKRQANKAAQEKKDQPTIDFIQGVYTRLGKARAEAKVSVEKLFDAQARYKSPKDMAELESLEAGAAKVTPYTNLPFGYSVSADMAEKFIRVADVLDCSIDYLLGRDDNIRPVAGWQAGDPWNFGEYVVLVRYDSAKALAPEKMSWTEFGWEMLGSIFEDICSDATIVGWMPMPEEE